MPLERRLSCTRMSIPTAIMLLWSIADIGIGQETWTMRSPEPTANTLYSITYGLGRYIAVGSVGVIISSVDASSWVRQYSGTEATLLGVARGGELFTTVGTNGLILTSLDGEQWIQRNSGISTTLFAVAWGNNRFVAVGDSGTILSSADGTTWSTRISGKKYGLRAITFGADLFVAVGDSGTALVSSDGIAWSQQDLAVTANLKTVTWGNKMFVAGGILCPVLTSMDGLTWLKHDSYVFMETVAWGNNEYVAMSDGNYSTSVNAMDWQTTIYESWGDLRFRIYYSVIWADGRFVAVGSNGLITAFLHPRDEETKQHLFPVSPVLKSATWGNEKFVIANESGEIATSPDGLTWSKVPGLKLFLSGLCWGGTAFAGVGYFNDSLYLSSDGTNWSAINARVSDPLFDITWGNGKFVAVGKNGTITTSPDGYVWSNSISPVDKKLNCVVWGKGGYVAAGDSGTILSSSDGISWVCRESGIKAPVLSVAWGDNLFVGVTRENIILTSADGIAWTKHAIDYGLSSITWGNHRFVAVGNGGTIAVSEDGTQWVRQKSGISQRLNDVTYGSHLFVAIGDNDIILSSPDATSIAQPQRNCIGPQNIAIIGNSLHYTIRSSSMVSVRLFDFRGRMVYTMHSSFQHAGRYSIGIPRNWPQGRYLLSFRAGAVNFNKTVLIGL